MKYCNETDLVFLAFFRFTLAGTFLLLFIFTGTGCLIKNNMQLVSLTNIITNENLTNITEY